MKITSSMMDGLAVLQTNAKISDLRLRKESDRAGVSSAPWDLQLHARRQLVPTGAVGRSYDELINPYAEPTSSGDPAQVKTARPAGDDNDKSPCAGTQATRSASKINKYDQSASTCRRIGGCPRPWPPHLIGMYRSHLGDVRLWSKRHRVHYFLQRLYGLDRRKKFFGALQGHVLGSPGGHGA